jgi:RNA processing factor Prp31
MPSRILEKIKERVKQLNEQPPKPKTKEQQMNFGILKSSETPCRTKQKPNNIRGKINNII